jgi:hypothetical protein
MQTSGLLCNSVHGGQYGWLKFFDAKQFWLFSPKLAPPHYLAPRFQNLTFMRDLLRTVKIPVSQPLV